MKKHREGVRVLIVPEGKAGHRTRSWYLTPRRWVSIKVALAIAAVLWVVGVGLGLYFAGYAALVPGLRSEVAQLEAERERAGELARRLERMEARYQQIRVMLGAGSTREALPPLVPSEQDDRAEAAPRGPERPDVWPLLDRGFITREHLVDVEGRHPGLDIAVPEGAYIRAAGGGEVVEVGRDEIYGIFVRIGHGDGLETVYAHASEAFVAEGQPVEAREVIALTGSTGRSTAPHLHFEVTRDGEPLDPREYIGAEL